MTISTVQHVDRSGDSAPSGLPRVWSLDEIRAARVAAERQRWEALQPVQWMGLHDVITVYDRVVVR